ncbi:hypothetical protein GCM10007414_08880 [Agarivorans gilvus]|uniref:Uncharacterized protein n=1 Tax=Agarivorans gilvus TaxID=680279 RepID=A0ABQ1HZM6_9ALTE|nr:hypothetical protein GCM10007414_08880 [Agarivorans gilvus]
MVSQFKIRCEIDPISQAAARPRSQALTKVLTKLILPNSNKSYINIIGHRNHATGKYALGGSKKA